MSTREQCDFCLNSFDADFLFDPGIKLKFNLADGYDSCWHEDSTIFQTDGLPGELLGDKHVCENCKEDLTEQIKERLIDGDFEVLGQ